MRYLSYYRLLLEEGCGEVLTTLDEDGGGLFQAQFTPDEDDIRIFPELAEVELVIVQEDSDGNLSGEILRKETRND